MQNRQFQQQQENSGIFGAIDQFVLSLPKAVHITLALAGGAIGYFYAANTHAWKPEYILFGLLAGLVAIPLLAMLIKLLLLSAGVLCAFGIIYYCFIYPHTNDISPQGAKKTADAISIDEIVSASRRWFNELANQIRKHDADMGKPSGDQDCHAPPGVCP
jgi:hypothetical protein